MADKFSMFFFKVRLKSNGKGRVFESNRFKSHGDQKTRDSPSEQTQGLIKDTFITVKVGLARFHNCCFV